MCPRFRSDQSRIQLSVSGVTIDTVSWDTFEGGDIEPEMQNYNPGGMAPAVSMGGLRKRSPITLTRNWDSTLRGSYLALDGAAGIAPTTVTISTLLADGTREGNPRVYTGVLGKVTPPRFESTSSAAAMLSVEIDCNEDMN
jgi:hypothetical protein